MSTTTPNRGYPIPQTTDAPQIPQDISALGDAVDADMASIIATYLTPVTDSTPGSASTGFTDAGTYIRTILNGKQVMLKLLVTNASTITASGGDFTDVQCYQLDPEYCPPDAVNAAVGTGHVTGEAVLGSDGKVTLRSASDSIAAGSSVRATFSYTRS